MAKTDVSVFFNSKELRKMVDEERMNIDVTIRSLERRIDDLDHIIELTTETLANRSAGMADLARQVESLQDEMEEVRGWCGPLARPPEQGAK